MRLHLLDGTFELFRSFFGVKETHLSPQGMDVAATYGIMRSTLALVRRPEVSHIGAAFDTVIESFRNDLFPGYKSSAGVPDELLAQFPLAEEALEALGFTVWRMVEFEADDAIATAAMRWCDDVDQVVVASPDKDFAQCVLGDRVVVWDRMRDRVTDEPGVVERFGVAPESIPDYLALVGDTADRVPGLPGWGAKSAAAVLGRWGRLELIPPDPADWQVAVRGAARLAASLEEHRPDALLFRTLTTLRRDAPLGEDLDDLRWRGVDEDHLTELCLRLGFDRAVFEAAGGPART